MVAQLRPAVVGLEDLRREVDRLTKIGTPTRIAAAHVLQELHPDAEATTALVLVGLQADANYRYATARQTAVNNQKPTDGFLSPVRIAILNKLPYEGADAKRKMLLDFNLADLRLFRQTATAQGMGWFKKAEWADEALRVLETSGAESLRDLPLNEQSRLDALAREKWS